MNIARTVFTGQRILAAYNLTSDLVRNYAFKSDLKIKWVRPEKIPSFKPEKSGDLGRFSAMDLSQTRLDFKDSKELATANDVVRKLFSLKYAPRNKTTEIYYKETIDKVKRHQYDRDTIEAKIAKWTSRIRSYQELMERFPKNVKMKVFLNEMIDKRKKHLKYLRRWDYKKFEWLIEALEIVYKPPPSRFHWITRKESLCKLTDKYCDDIKEQRLKEYRELLQAEQPLFLEEKIRALEFIRNEQVECGAQVTVTQEEIDRAKQQLKDLNDERKQKEEN